MIEHIDAVQRMQDYIQMNIEKDITMADLARAQCILRGIPIGYLFNFWT